MKLEQEPKYIIEGQVVNRQSNHPIPDDEPVFLLRGRDAHAIEMLEYYQHLVSEGPQEHLDAVTYRVEQFMRFAEAHPDRMHEPDTQLTSDWEKTK